MGLAQFPSQVQLFVQMVQQQSLEHQQTLIADYHMFPCFVQFYNVLDLNCVATHFTCAGLENFKGIIKQ